MCVKRCHALFLSVAFTVTALGAVPILTNNDQIDQAFKYTDPDAKTVNVAGEFSNWSELPMTKDDTGTWLRTIHLKPGYYGYKLIVNGEWVLDPANPAHKEVNDIEDSAVSVGGVLSAVATLDPSAPGKTPTTFSYTDVNARSVSIAGEFNQWSATANPLQKDQQGLWTATISLKPGKYAYKFVVDGTWKADPLSPDGADDGFSGKNAVKTVGP
jgi:1,4-alpha-glucan branching enzyme